MFEVNNKDTRTTPLGLRIFDSKKAPLHFECIQKYVFRER